MSAVRGDGAIQNEGTVVQDRTLITTGALGSAIAAICCATPLLAIGLGAVGLSTWLASADYILIPIFVVCLGLVWLGWGSTGDGPTPSNE
jgi:mercuric ion transport protein